MAKIRGLVTDAAGAALAGVTLDITDAAGAVTQARTDNAGTYDSGSLAAGNYTLQVQAPAGFQNPPPANVAVPAGNQTVQSDFQLAVAVAPAQPGSITGTVTDPGNQPVPNAQVTATAGAGVAQPAAAATDALGAFAIPNLPAGAYTVTVQAAGFQNPAPVQVNVVAGQASVQNFALQPVAAPAGVGSITGLVTNVTNPGQPNQVVTPLPNVVVTATLVGGAALLPVLTDSSGRYTISNVAPGAYDVAFEVPGTAQPQPPVQVQVAQAAVARDFQVLSDPVAAFLGNLVHRDFDIENAVSIDEARYATQFFRVANVIFAAMSDSSAPLDVFGSQGVGNLAERLGIRETDAAWQQTLQEVEQLKKDVRDLIGLKAVDRLRSEAKRQFNLGTDQSVDANVRFPEHFRRFVELATSSILTMDIEDQDQNNKVMDKARIGEADAALRELKEIVVQLVRSLSKEGQAQTRIDTEAWVAVAQRGMTIAGKLGTARRTGDRDDENPWAVVSVLTNKNRDIQVIPYVVLSRHGGRLLELALQVYEAMRVKQVLTAFDSRSLREVFQDPRFRSTSPRMFFTDQIREQAVYLKTYPLANWS